METTEAGLVTLSSTSNETQAHVLIELSKALEYLKYVASTRDYFVGYSLPEVMFARIAEIGTEEEDDSSTATVAGKRTKIANVNYLREVLLGTDGKSGVLGDLSTLIDAGKQES